MRGSVVLIHGAWGHPEDWRWVIAHLPTRGLEIHTPDLPSHRSAALGLAADAAAVSAVLRAARPPVVAAGWSYGGDVLGDAAAGHQSLARLVYVAAVPRPVGAVWDPTGDGLAANPHIDVGDDGAFVLDDAWWLTEELGATLPTDVQKHLWLHRRRRVGQMAHKQPQAAAAWRVIPTTVVLGHSDDLISDEDWISVRAHISDVRTFDTDHFILWRQPQAISDIILEALDTASECAAHTAEPNSLPNSRP